MQLLSIDAHQKRLAYDAAWRARSRDTIRASSRKYYLTHKSDCARRNAEHYVKNKTRVSARKAKYNRENAALIKSRVSARMQADPERFRRYRKNSYERNKSRIREYLRVHRASVYQRDKEKIAKRSKSYHARNRDQISERRRLRRALKPGLRRAESQKYYRKNPLRFLAAANVRRARKNNASIGNTKLIEEWIKSVRSKPRATCYWCKASTPSNNINIDHIQALVSGGAHEVGNLCVSCGTCNSRKHAKPLTAWNHTLLEPVLF